MTTCFAFGLGLRSNVSVPGLQALPASTRVDVALHLDALPPDLGGTTDAQVRDIHVAEASDGSGEPLLRIARVRDAYYRLSYSDGTTLVVDAGGSAIWAAAPRGASLEDTATYLLGPALGFLLRLRGITCLHASVVEVGGAAIAFVGASGAGKSSLAAAFALAGHGVLTDDLAPLERCDARFRVHAAYPRIRLWEDSAAALFGAADALPRLTPNWDKRYVDLTGPGFTFADGALALGAIYLIERSDDARAAPRIEPVRQRQALVALMAQTYAARIADCGPRGREFEELSLLAAQVPVARLIVPDDLGALPAARAAVLADRARNAAEA